MAFRKHFRCPAGYPYLVMAGLVPAIHVFAQRPVGLAEGDARIKFGHDGVGSGRLAVGSSHGE